MKFRLKITLHLLVYILFVMPLLTLNSWSAVDTGDVVNVPDPVVHIPDPMLEQALRKAMELHPNLKITKERIARLSALNASNQGITDLTGLEHAIRLTNLIIAFNPISDLTPLTNLIGLRRLDARGCNISDLTPLANLRYLVELQLSGNQIEEITPVENLKRLRRLEIDDNPLTDDSVLGQFKPVDIPDSNLRAAVRRALSLSEDFPITQGDMRKLTELDARDSQITNLTGLEYATNLVFLSLGDNNIADLAPLAELVKLERLWLSYNPLSDISPLANLTELKHLALKHCEISDISSLANLTQLTGLALTNNRVVDVRPLANLTMLRELEIDRNFIIDHSPLDSLSLTHFLYDQSCKFPPLPLQPRLENRSFPSVFSAWGGLWWSSVLNQPHLSDMEQMAQHDLWFSSPMFSQDFFDTGDGWEMRGNFESAKQQRNDVISLNPNMVFLVGIEMRATEPGTFSADSPYWVRDANGERVSGGPGSYLVNFTHPDVQEIIIQQAIAVSKCGLYDGIFFDWWHESIAILSDHRSGWAEGWIGFAEEQRTRDNIIKSIRSQTRPDFLIMVNTNRGKIPRTGPYINGLFMETGTPSADSNDGGAEAIEQGLREIEETLLWAEANLMEPHINGLEGWGFPTEPPDSPTNLRWMRAFTTLSLTHSDGYVLFNDGIQHNHYWYDFWDADLGRPVREELQLYPEIEGLYIREFTNGWAVYNHSGSPQILTLPEEVRAVASGLVNTEHALPNLDGEMYLRVKPVNPADVNGDGTVNILDLTLVAQALSTGDDRIDVNGDGVVNVFDLVFVANQF